MSTVSHTYEKKCEVCGHPQVIGNYADFTCRSCGAEHKYDEGTHVVVTEGRFMGTIRPIQWTGAAGDSRFDNPANWEGGVVPTDAEKIRTIPLPPGAPYFDRYREEYLKAVWPAPIPVAERLPEEGQSVLAFNSTHKEWADAGFGHGKFFCNDSAGGYTDDRDDVTHWLPLPPKPE